MIAAEPVRLSTVLRQVKRPVAVDRAQTYREIGVRSHGRGIFHKDAIAGAELGDKSVFWVEPGTLVFNIVFAWEGAVAVASAAESGFIASHRFPAYRVNPLRADARFLRYYFGSDEGLFLLGENSPGAAGRNKTLDQGRLLKEKVQLPSAAQQRWLADFLDHKTAAIDSLIVEKERLIELLQEKRQSLITQAVTKGLDPSVPMKESGIEWLGQIPLTWGVQELRHRLRRIEQGWSPSCENRQADEHEWGVLKVGCVNYGRFRDTENKALPLDLQPEPSLEVRGGDVLVSRANTRELVGSAAYVDRTRPRLLLCDKLFRLHYRGGVDPRFLVLLLQSSVCRYQFERDATGASDSMQNIGQDSVRRLVFAWPQEHEQRRIVETVSRRTALIDHVGEQLSTHITTLKEYRQALIASAVTGKIQVPRGEVAA